MKQLTQPCRLSGSIIPHSRHLHPNIDVEFEIWEYSLYIEVKWTQSIYNNSSNNLEIKEGGRERSKSCTNQRLRVERSQAQIALTLLTIYLYADSTSTYELTLRRCPKNRDSCLLDRRVYGVETF